MLFINFISFLAAQVLYWVYYPTEDAGKAVSDKQSKAKL